MKTFDGSEKRSGEKDILLVLDANEYIFGLSELKDTSVKLLDVLPFVEGVKVVVPNTVLDEAMRNLRYIHSILWCGHKRIEGRGTIRLTVVP